jgi:hypothetical protein
MQDARERGRWSGTDEKGLGVHNDTPLSASAWTLRVFLLAPPRASSSFSLPPLPSWQQEQHSTCGEEEEKTRNWDKKEGSEMKCWYAFHGALLVGIGGDKRATDRDRDRDRDLSIIQGVILNNNKEHASQTCCLLTSASLAFSFSTKLSPMPISNDSNIFSSYALLLRSLNGINGA